MSFTRAPQVKAALKTLLERHLSGLTLLDSPIVVLYGHPGQTVPPVHVAVNNVVNLTHEQRTMPFRPEGGTVEETAGVELICYALTGAQDPEAQQRASEAAWELTRLTDEAIRADITLADLIREGLLRDASEESGWLAEGRYSQVTTTYTYSCRV